MSICVCYVIRSSSHESLHQSAMRVLCPRLPVMRKRADGHSGQFVIAHVATVVIRGLDGADARDSREWEIARKEVSVVAVHALAVFFLPFRLCKLAFVVEERVQLVERLIALRLRQGVRVRRVLDVCT